MANAALALAMLGLAIGVVSRLRVLLPILAMLVAGSILYSVARDYTFVGTLITVMATQAIVQSCYFTGLIVRALFMSDSRARRPVL